jgi:hypothetical protein
MSETPTESPLVPGNFEQLAAARREWIEKVLRPWCQSSALQDLRKAEVEWFDIAGRADTSATLWTWAWERFPDIVHPDLPGVNETFELCITLTDGSQISGFPDGRKSQRGMLIVLGVSDAGERQTHGPISIDQIAAVTRI